MRKKITLEVIAILGVLTTAFAALSGLVAFLFPGARPAGDDPTSVWFAPLFLTPLALAGVGMLLVSSLVAKKKRKLLGWSVLAFAVLLAATAAVFNLTGLSTGETALSGTFWGRTAIIVSLIYALVLLGTSAVGVSVARDILRMEPSRPTVSVTPGVLIGWLLPCAIGATAWGVGLQFPVLGAPVVAILIGLVVGQVFGQHKEWAAGVKFASKRVLQTAIVLLGAGMSLGQVARIGGAGLPVMIGTLALCVGGGIVISRAMRVERQTRILVTYGTAICGASAIATMSAVIGASGAAVALAVTVIVVYNVLGAVLFPPLGHLMGLSQEAFGLWAGTAVNDTSSVMAAAAAYGSVAASYAVVVKLTRTLAIVPLALFQTWFQNRQLPVEQRHATVWYRLIPPFLVWFLVAAAVRSTGIIPDAWTAALKFLAHFGITVAMGAVGMGSSLKAIKDAGWRPVALGGILWLLVATSSLALQWLLGQL